MKFLTALWDSVVKPHPLMFALFLVVVVLTLGGLVWWLIGAAVGLIRKVSPTVGDKALNAVGAVASATGSA